MEAISNKNLVIALIKDDLAIMKLLGGLEALGFDTGQFSPYLGETIFTLLGFKENLKSDFVYERVYLAMAEKVNSMDIHSRERLEVLAEDIYNELVQAKGYIQK